MNKLARFQTLSNESIGEQENSTQVLDVNPVIETPEETNPLDEIKDASDAISTEAFGGVDALKSAIEKIPGYLSGISTFIRNRFNKDEIKNNFYKPESIRKISAPSNYLVYSKNRVFKAPGQKVKMLDLVNLLSDTNERVVGVFVKVEFPQIERQVATLATNPKEMKSVRINDLVSKTLYSTFKEHVKLIGDCFDPRDTSAQELFGNLYDRNADFETVLQKLNKLNEEVYHLNIDSVIGLVDSFDASIQLIIDFVDNKENEHDFSPVVIKALAEASYKVAELVEFYSVYLYKLKEVSVAVKDTVDALK